MPCKIATKKAKQSKRGALTISQSTPTYPVNLPQKKKKKNSQLKTEIGQKNYHISCVFSSSVTKIDFVKPILLKSELILK